MRTSAFVTIPGTILAALLVTMLASNSAIAQLWWKPVPFRPHLPLRSVDTVPTSRWLISANPLAILEGPAAFSAGIGYRINPRYELWSETSLLWNLIYHPDQKAIGFRQILQFKRFLNKPLNSFVALEIRYKQFSFSDTGNFFNPVSHDTIFNDPFKFERHFIGAALQLGRRRSLSKDGRWQLELSIGLGVKFAVISRPGIPNGYEFDQRQLSGDLTVRDFWEVPGYAVYFPGSLRLIYTFGKRLP
jgi:hypothetical protein